MIITLILSGEPNRFARLINSTNEYLNKLQFDQYLDCRHPDRCSSATVFGRNSHRLVVE